MKRILLLLYIPFIISTVYAQSNQRFIVLEHFTNTTCPACGNKNPVFIEDIYEPYQDDIIHVAFHHNLPVPDLDPFNLYNPIEAEDRFLYYGSPGQPRMLMNGSLIPVQTGQPLLPLSTFTAELGQSSPVAVEISEVTNGNMRDVTVEVHTLASGLISDDLVLRVGVVEKYILFPTYFESEFHNVFREWLNSSNGSPYTPANPGSSVSFSFSYELDDSWQPNEIYTIAYIQDNSTKEIINGGSSLLGDSPPALNVGLLSFSDILCPEEDGFLEVMDDCGASISMSYTLTEIEGMSLDEMINPETGSDENGSVEVDVSGGTPPYSFIWSNGNNTASNENLTSGVYNLTIVDDNGCTISASYTVPQLTNSMLISSNTLDACEGQDNGSASINVSGGAPPYSYEWSHGAMGQTAENLAPGNYIVIITDNYGFEALEIISIEEISYTYSLSTISEINGNADGSVNLQISSDWDYLLMDDAGYLVNSFNGLSSGLYTYTIDFGNGCTETISFTIDPLNYSISAIQNACFGETEGSIIVNDLEPSDLSLNWSNGSSSQTIEGLENGNYCVVISNGMGTTVSECVDIISPEVLLADANINTEQNSISLNITGGAPPYSVSWSNGDTGTDISDLESGTYSAEIMDYNGCTISESYLLEALSDALLNEDKTIDIFPNPASEEIQIMIESPILHISIIDELGRTLISEKETNSIDISSLESGIYLIHIQSLKGAYLDKVVISRN